jgi:hypothetical protein
MFNIDGVYLVVSAIDLKRRIRFRTGYNEYDMNTNFKIPLFSIFLSNFDFHHEALDKFNILERPDKNRNVYKQLIPCG